MTHERVFTLLTLRIRVDRSQSNWFICSSIGANLTADITCKLEQACAPPQSSTQTNLQQLCCWLDNKKSCSILID